MTQQPKKLLDQVRETIRLKHYPYSTEKTCVYWAKRFVLDHNKRHPLEMGEKEISEFLTHLAVEEDVAASTQSQGHQHWYRQPGYLRSRDHLFLLSCFLPLRLSSAELPKGIESLDASYSV